MKHLIRKWKLYRYKKLFKRIYFIYLQSPVLQTTLGDALIRAEDDMARMRIRFDKISKDLSEQ